MAVQAAIPVTETFAPPAWGSSHPIGAVLTADGVNVSVYAKRATRSTSCCSMASTTPRRPGRRAGPGD